jgi:hypothetical protein
VWLRKLLSDLFSAELEPTVIHCDNQSCIKLFENLVFHDRLKHIEMRYHYVCDMVQKNISQYTVCSDGRTNHIYFDQATVLDKVCVLSRQAWCC